MHQPDDHSGSHLDVDELTAPEAQVLELIAQEPDNATIGPRRGISQRTARNHVSAVFSKLGVSTRAKATVLARDAGSAPGRSKGNRRDRF